jgi:OOP family OmpA-OmpF porin
MTPGYQTSNPSFYHIDLGTRYTINPHRYKGDIGYDKFTNKSNTKEFNSNYIRVNLQTLSYAFALYNGRTDGYIISCRSWSFSI